MNLDKLPETYVMKAAHGWNMNLFVQNGIIINQSQATSHKGELADQKTLHLSACTILTGMCWTPALIPAHRPTIKLNW